MVLHEKGKNSAHFVESVGYTGLPDFMRELEGVKEQEIEKSEPEEVHLCDKFAARPKLVTASFSVVAHRPRLP